MKDLPHHMKKLNRRIIRSMHREEHMEELLPEVPTWPDTRLEAKKKEKRKRKMEGEAKVSHHHTPEERNRIMKTGRVPVFDRINNALPKHAPPTKKKTPRI